MDTKPYNDQEGKKAQVTKMFDRIAFRYDGLNRFLSLGLDQLWRKRALQNLIGRKADLLLDVATGTGDVAIAAVQKYGVQKVTGLDIAKEMLSIGRQKIAKKQLSDQIEMIHGDAENLPFEDNTYDGITVAFGVRNFESLEKGLAEMWRVLKPGGIAIILEFSRPQIFPFKQVFNLYFKYILPRIGRLTSKDPRAYRYLYESVQTFPEGDDFLGQLSNTGFNQVQCTRLTFGVCSIYTGIK